MKELEQYGEDLGVKQGFDEEEKDKVIPILGKARSYLREVVFQEPQYAPVRENCKNLHAFCAFWAAVGECESNANYMNVTCAPVCQSCDFLLALQDKAPPALDPSLAS
jgi:hypothetical protein